MADIFVDADSIDNINIVTTPSSINFTLSADSIDNISVISTDDEITRYITATSISNTNTVSNIDSINFTILPSSIVNVNRIPGPIYVDILSRTVSADSISNTSIVDVPIVDAPYLISATPIININDIPSIIGIGKDRTIVVDSILNNNIISQPLISFEDIPVVGEYKNRATPLREKVARFVFADVSFDFLPHPLTGDIAVLYDTDAINQSLYNLIHTKRFERPFELYSASSRIRSLLFEMSSNMLSTEIKKELFSTIVNNEPRVTIIDIIVKDVPQSNAISIDIFYKIKTFEKIEKFSTIITRR